MTESKEPRELKSEKSDPVPLMQLFCLEPTAENFAHIESLITTKIRNEQGESLETWERAVRATYPGIDGRTEPDQQWSRDTNALVAKLLRRPTYVALNKVWYIFFATGRYDFLSLAYQTGGNTYANHELREAATSCFNDIRDRYREKLDLIGAGMRTPQVEKVEQAWAQLQSEIDAANEKIEESRWAERAAEDELDDATNEEVDSTANESQSEPKESEREKASENDPQSRRREKERKIKEACGEFDTVAAKVLRKMKL